MSWCASRISAGTKSANAVASATTTMAIPPTRRTSRSCRAAPTGAGSRASHSMRPRTHAGLSVSSIIPSMTRPGPGTQRSSLLLLGVSPGPGLCSDRVRGRRRDVAESRRHSVSGRATTDSDFIKRLSRRNGRQLGRKFPSGCAKGKTSMRSTCSGSSQRFRPGHRCGSCGLSQTRRARQGPSCNEQD